MFDVMKGGDLSIEDSFCIGVTKWGYIMRFFPSSQNFSFYFVNRNNIEIVFFIDIKYYMNEQVEEFNDVLFKNGSNYGNYSFCDRFIENKQNVSIFIRINNVQSIEEFKEHEKKCNEETKVALVLLSTLPLLNVYDSKLITMKKQRDNQLFRIQSKEFDFHGLKFGFEFVEKTEKKNLSKFYIRQNQICENIYLSVRIIFKILGTENLKQSYEFKTPFIIYEPGYATGFTYLNLDELFEQPNREDYQIQISLKINKVFMGAKEKSVYFDKIYDPSFTQEIKTITIKCKGFINVLHSDNFTLCNLPHYIYFYPSGKDRDDEYNCLEVFSDIDRNYTYHGKYTIEVLKKDSNDKLIVEVKRFAEMRNRRILPFDKLVKKDYDRDWEIRINLEIFLFNTTLL